MAKKQRTYNVEPLRTAAEIEAMKNALKEVGDRNGQTNGDRNRFLFTFGINTGLRISDIVGLKVGDVRNKVYLDVIEKKTNVANKQRAARRIDLTGISGVIATYCTGKPSDAYLFPSRKGDAPISTTQAYRILSAAGEWLGRDDIGSHSLRKTYGYHVYKLTNDIIGLMEDFGHATPAITKLYIGVTEEERRDARKGFSL